MKLTQLLVPLVVLVTSSQNGTPTSPMTDCAVGNVEVAPWSVTLATSLESDSKCLTSVGMEATDERLAQTQTYATLEVPGSLGEPEFSITFAGGDRTPDIVTLSGRYGETRSNYKPITVCLAERVVRTDGRDKNADCRVDTNDQGDMVVHFRLPQQMHPLEELTLLVVVEWLTPESRNPEEFHRLNHWVINIKRIE